MATETKDPGRTPDDVAPASSEAYAWYVVAALLIVSVLGYLDRLILGFLIEPIRADLKLSDTQMGVVSGVAFALLYVVMGAPIGWLLDRLHRPRVLAVCVAIWSACTAACGAATGFFSLFLARVGVGAGEAALNPAAVSLISDYFGPGRAVRPLGVFTLGIYIGGGLAIILGGQLVAYVETLGAVTLPWFGELSGWRVVFIAVAIPGLIVAPLLALTVREPRLRSPASELSAPSNHFAGKEQPVTNSLLVRLMAGFIAFGFGIYALLAWFPAMLTRSYGLSSTEIAWTYGPIYLVGGAAGALALGPITDMVRSRGREDASLIVAIAAMSVLAAASIAGPLMPAAWACLSMIALVMPCWALVLGSSFALVAELIPASIRGRATGIYMVALNLSGGALGPVLVGVLTDHVYGPDRLDWALATVAAAFGPLAVALMAAARRQIYRVRALRAA